jgi:hypothetical protein
MSASRKALRIEAVLWVIVMAAAILFSAALLVRHAGQRAELAQLQTEKEELAARIADLQTKSADQALGATDQPGLMPWDIDELKKKGLQDPLKDLAADLQKHPELIPYEGVLGGTMAFAFPEKIHVLTDKYVLAYFEDGHIAGWMLLEYGVSRGGRITWRVIDSYME